MKGIRNIICLLAIFALNITANADGISASPDSILAKADSVSVKPKETIAKTNDLTILRMSKIQRKQFDGFLKNTSCSCGCGMKVGICLRDDPNCSASPKLTRSAIQQILAGTYHAKYKSVANNSNLSLINTPTNTSHSYTLDNGLIGAWKGRIQAGSIEPIQETRKIVFNKNGKVSYGVGDFIESDKATASLRPKKTNSVSFGNWHIDGKLLHILWNNGKKQHYKYEKMTYADKLGLMMIFGEDKRYFNLTK